MTGRCQPVLVGRYAIMAARLMPNMAPRPNLTKQKIQASITKYLLQTASAQKNPRVDAFFVMCSYVISCFCVNEAHTAMALYTRPF